MRVLITGGAGYIGIHTASVLANKSVEFTILDNFSRSKIEAIERLSNICGFNVDFVCADIRDESKVANLLLQEQFDAVIHFAAYKSISESIASPISYYENNVGGLISLLKAMSKTECRKLIFSSSAAVYSPLAKSPYTELDSLRFTNPYAHTKIICEQILEGLCNSDPMWRVGILRYFNPAGAHGSGFLGEDPGQHPANLFPNILNAASGQSEAVKIYGGDYPTPDGTGIRDFIHIMDLAEAHFASIQALAAHKFHLVNVGSGEGSSVLEVIRKFEEVTGKKIARRFYPRRDGDLPIAYADVAKAENILGWRASRGVVEMCESAWKWKKFNPTGY